LQLTTGLLTVGILIFTLIVIIIVTQVIRARRGAVILRNLPAYRLMPSLIDESIEAERPVHFSFGSTAPGGVTTPLLLATTEAFTLLARKAAVGARTPLVTMSETATLPISYDILRRAYHWRRLSEQFRITAVQWYPEGARSLAFAAPLIAMMGDEHVSANILMGGFGPEIGLILEAAERRGQRALAASDQLEGQAVAFAMSDEPLIAEELFAGGAYLGGSAIQLSSVVVLDLLRVLLIAALLLLVADRVLIDGALSRLLGGA
jgi:hypothetical protein